jgi:predicted RND superfamily exporter protein
MAEQPTGVEERLPESAFSMRFARLTMRNRFATLISLLALTFFFSVPLVNAGWVFFTGERLPFVDRVFRIDANIRNTYPEHPFVHATDKFAGRFGSGSLVAMAIVKKEGDIYDPDFLDKVRRITDRIDQAPYINHYQVRSISHLNTRVVRIEPDGSITAEMLMEEVPEDEEELEEFRELVRQNPDLIYGLLVSKDETAAMVTAGFVTHRLDHSEGYLELWDYVNQIKVDEEADGTVDVYVTGEPIARGWVLRHAFEITMFLLMTIVMLFFLLLLYFRRLHGVAIPMVAGLTTAIWGMGFTGWMNITLDPLILVVPLLITARSVSHTVQMAERFFEDYEMEADALRRQVGRELTPDEITETKVETATTAMAKLMLPGMLGILTDAAGLMVLFITTIQVMRDLATFGSFWVVAIFFNVIMLHPIMIAYLPPPHETKHYTPTLMNWLLRKSGELATGRLKHAIVGVVVVAFGFSLYYVLFNSTIGESRPGAPVLWPDHEFNVSTGKVNDYFGGADDLMVFVDGDNKSASSDGYVLQNLEGLDRYMKAHNERIGNSLSLVSLIRLFWQAQHSGDPKWGFVPDTANTIGGIIFQMRNQSTPGALRQFLTDDAEDAAITFFFRDHQGETIAEARHWAEQFIREHPMGRLNIRLEQQPSRFLDGLYYMVGPILFPRARHLEVRVAEIDEQQEILGYTEEKGTPVGKWTERLDRDEVAKLVLDEITPTRGDRSVEPALDTQIATELRVNAKQFERLLGRLSAEQDYRIESVYKAPEDIAADWYKLDVTIGEIVDWIVDRSEYLVVEEWQGGKDNEVTARVIRSCSTWCDYELWVKNDKFKDRSFNAMATGSYTRGAEMVLAGGLMGINAAVNEEVERGHLANILMIFLIVFTFVSVSYRSSTGGLVIMFSLACATVFSFAYMAFRKNGLNVNTLPVQAVGVGIGVDYAIYVTDRIRQEYSWCGDLDEGIRRAIRTTGMAVSFTATTLVGGIICWSFSNLRFQAEMAQLLSILMVVNMIGAIFLVPALFSILRPRFFATSLQAVKEQPVEEAETVRAGLRQLGTSR